MPRPPRLVVIEGGARPPALREPGGAALELIALGVAVTLVATWMGRLPAWFHHLGALQALASVLFALTALALLRRRRYAAVPRAGMLVFGVALACRAALMPVTPSLSDDVHRYAWEGRVAAHGMDPYRHAPNDPVLRTLRDDRVWPRVNHPELAAIYPPLAIAGFALVARLAPGVLPIKLWVVLHDLALVAVLLALARRARMPAITVAAYAWNPLVLIEYAGSAHYEPVALLWLGLAFLWCERRPRLAALALAAATLVKPFPLVALPFLARRWPWRARLAGLALLLPGLGLWLFAARGAQSGLLAYWRAWSNNELAFHYAVRWTGSFAAARTLALLAVALVVAFLLWRRVAPQTGARWAARAALLLGPVLHPWYLGWELMHQPLAPSWPWLLLSWTALVNYGFLATPPEGHAFHPPLSWRWIEYGVPLACALAIALARRRRPAARAEVAATTRSP